MNIIDALATRHSTRAFQDRPVAHDLIEHVLEHAAHAPSGVNSQPWQVCVVTGDTKRRLSEALVAARTDGRQENPDYLYYPKTWREPYKSRRKACGLALYGALGIGIEDPTRRMEAWLQNYLFFGAPVNQYRTTRESVASFVTWRE